MLRAFFGKGGGGTIARTRGCFQNTAAPNGEAAVERGLRRPFEGAGDARAEPLCRSLVFVVAAACDAVDDELAMPKEPQ